MIVIIPELLRPGVVGSLLWVWVCEVQLGLEELEIMADFRVLGACGWGPIMLHSINKNSMILHYRPLYHPRNMNIRTLLHISISKLETSMLANTWHYLLDFQLKHIYLV